MSYFCGRRFTGDGLEFRKAPSVCPSSLVFRRVLLTLSEDGIYDGGPAAAVTERLFIAEKGDMFLLLGDLKFLCPVCSAGFID